MSNMMLPEVSLIDSAILNRHTFGHTTALSTSIRPNNINHQEKRHHSNIKGQRRYNADLRHTQSRAPKPSPERCVKTWFCSTCCQVPLTSKWESIIKESQENMSVLVIRPLVFHVWGAPTQLVKRRRWRGRSSKCQQPSLSMMILLLVTASPCQTWCSLKFL